MANIRRTYGEYTADIWRIYGGHTANGRLTYGEHTTNIRRACINNCRGHTADIQRIYANIIVSYHVTRSFFPTLQRCSVFQQRYLPVLPLSALIANWLRCPLHQQSWKGSCKLLQSPFLRNTHCSRHNSTSFWLGHYSTSWQLSSCCDLEVSLTTSAL